MTCPHLIESLSGQHSDCLFGADFCTLHAASALREPNRVNPPYLRIVRVWMIVFKRRMHQKDRGVAYV